MIGIMLVASHTILSPNGTPVTQMLISPFKREEVKGFEDLKYFPELKETFICLYGRL